MKLQTLTKKLNRIKTFVSLSKKSIIVAEINHYCILDDFLDSFDNVFICNISKSDSYIDDIKNTKFNNVIVYGFWDKYEDVKSISSEINYSRDIYNSLNKNIILVLPTCVVEYIMYFALSIWSCVTIHEVFEIAVEVPFDFIWLSKEDNKLFLNKQFLLNINEQDVFCNKLNCTKCNCCDCFKRIQSSDFSKCDLIMSYNQSTLQQSLSRLLDLGDLYYELGRYQLSEKTYEFVLLKAEKGNLCMHKSISQRCLAKLYYTLGEYEKSIIYYIYAFNSEKDVIVKYKIYNDLAISLFDHIESNKSAYEYLKKSEKTFLDNNEYDLLAIVEYNIAIYYLKNENKTCAIDYLNKLLNLGGISDQIKIRARILKSYLLISIGDFGNLKNCILKKINNFSDMYLFDYNELNYERFFLEAYYNFSVSRIGASLKKINKSWDMLKQYNMKIERYTFCLYYLKLLDYIFWDLKDNIEKELRLLKNENQLLFSVHNKNKCIKLIYDSK